MNEILNAIISRRSCKQFKPDPVPREIVEQVVQAGLYAPSGGNRQPVKIIAVTDKVTRDQLSRLNSKYDSAGRIDPFYGAPVVLAVVVDKSIPTALNDGSLALGYMLLAAHSLGIGSCWIHRAREVFEDEKAKALLRAQGLEGDYLGIGHCVLGWPVEPAGDPLPRKENRTFFID